MKFVWPDSARSELRGLDRESAIRILLALTHFGDSGEGDMKGDFRVIFRIASEGIVIVRVRHRSDVYQ